MRRRIVASATLSVLLAIGAMPQLAGSLTPSRYSPQPDSGFRTFDVPTGEAGSFEPVAYGTTVLPGLTPSPTPVPTAKPTPKPTPRPTPRPTPKPTPRPTAPPPSKILKGYATWYNNGTTAMRLPRGTRVKICGKGGCITRTIGDWGPAAWTNRIADLTPADFRAVCACSTSQGVAYVTVYIL